LLRHSSSADRSIMSPSRSDSSVLGLPPLGTAPNRVCGAGGPTARWPLLLEHHVVLGRATSSSAPGGGTGQRIPLV